MASIYCACFAAAASEWRASTAPASQPQHLPAILPPNNLDCCKSMLLSQPSRSPSIQLAVKNTANIN
ncbi:hypothetical protein PR003_g24948 [Phytophthora rubi]|uniref:Uncharacterized protein n=1 Tax=Phytophthora rubi TaxID=129364 RepID=A0A6A3JK67_9STRA|nr:hypothetical protein PR002_g22304 [Phytophthora rubi]KAE8992805.1 hypothetical protein PR001_g20846 [Phytophthora rubi]KAE9291738.1 hypothetical protein PR003_g24948 [Phytophthora rubi]